MIRIIRGTRSLIGYQSLFVVVCVFVARDRVRGRRCAVSFVYHEISRRYLVGAFHVGSDSNLGTRITAKCLRDAAFQILILTR